LSKELFSAPDLKKFDRREEPHFLQIYQQVVPFVAVA